jgi:hypothetical protein
MEFFSWKFFFLEMERSKAAKKKKNGIFFLEIFFLGDGRKLTR